VFTFFFLKYELIGAVRGWNLVYTCSSHETSKGQSVLIIAKEGCVHKQDLAAPDVNVLAGCQCSELRQLRSPVGV